MEDYFVWLSLAGTAVFALSGALMALRQGMDVVGVSFIATVTGIGGGTIRDLFLGKVPLGWVAAPMPVTVCIAAAVLACFCNRFILGHRMTWLLYADAAGMALFAVLGARAADISGAHPLVSVLMGAMSASLGGILRDVICNETPLLLKHEIYITAAVIGGAVYIATPFIPDPTLRAGIAILVALAIRILAIRRNLRLSFPKPLAPLDTGN